MKDDDLVSSEAGVLWSEATLKTREKATKVEQVIAALDGMAPFDTLAGKQSIREILTSSWSGEYLTDSKTIAREICEDLMLPKKPYRKIFQTEIDKWA